MTKLIAIDPGHGSDTYPPNKGVPGMAEHSFNAAVAHYVKPLLESSGFQTMYTQTPNASERPLRQRTEDANHRRADLFCSIHADANANSSVRGHWAFYWHTSELGKRLADVWSHYLSRETGTHHRGNVGSKPNHWTNFHVLRETRMPAVLMEHGFMTNPQDLARLKSDPFRRQSAVALAKAICDFYGVPYKGEEGKRYMEVQSRVLRKKFEEVINDGANRGLIGKSIPDQYEEGKLPVDDAIAAVAAIVTAKPGSTIPHAHKSAVKKAVASGVTNGERMNEPATRAQVMTFLDRTGQL
ncbi:N-acetylmuramoyl-L-alanine amidase [Geomicrobium halophilum]|uniref:N-acetylmuramoyl-L-alanine amidase n=1 Tax=Geomicrobium halophilum TaxID=549000 RepID=A0A841PWQ3_9BACL|nr:N-acetylmuramoyl-L-alanine amidase [Geomicrobium halophilum]